VQSPSLSAAPTSEEGRGEIQRLVLRKRWNSQYRLVQDAQRQTTEGEAIMNIIKDEPATLKRARRITLELAPGETVGCIKEGGYYRLGGQVDDIVQSHVITEMTRVYWCSIAQKWEEA
jgi:hypothetical protein